MSAHSAKVLFHNANTDVVQMSCRRYPSVALEGERLSGLFDAMCLVVAECKRSRNQEGYDEAHTIANILQTLLADYEQALREQDKELPYAIPIAERWLSYEDDLA